MDDYFEDHPNWRPEAQVDQGLATLIHKYLKVKYSVWSGVGCLETVIHLLKEWAEKQQRVSGMQSLTRKSLLVSILMLPNILTHLENIDEQLPRTSEIWHDYGVRSPHPQLNISFNPTNIHLHLLATLQTLKEQFDVLLLFMELVNHLATKEDTNVPSTQPDVFWRDVASTNGVTKKRTLEEIEIQKLPEHFVEIPSVEVIKTQWNEKRQDLEAVIHQIQSFLTDAKQMSEDNPNQETDISQNLTQQAK